MQSSYTVVYGAVLHLVVMLVCVACVLQVEMVVRKNAEYLLVIEGFSSTDKGNYELTVE